MKPLFLILLLTACAGCAILDNLDGAMTLKELSQEKDAQDAFVKNHDAQFGRLWQQLQAPDSLKRYQRKVSIEQEFGSPIFCQNDAGLDRCLWRQIVDSGKNLKVYIYFDDQGKLVRWEKS